ncbi:MULTISPECIES: hypothetical protein [unclassified Microbulbifer]|uniref:hypothetical protein n=1 Tax=unclassified Microbulbifer TaxID=2619833 RepID=UPI0027E3CE71|nr:MULTISPECIES: hypothetical protein [unclassified Microbulbifer]
MMNAEYEINTVGAAHGRDPSSGYYQSLVAANALVAWQKNRPRIPRSAFIIYEAHPCASPLRGSLRLCKPAILPVCPHSK